MKDTESEVCFDILRRQQLGIRKYGTTVAENPLELHQWLTHAYEEVLDQAVYLKRAIQELESLTGQGVSQQMVLVLAPVGTAEPEG